MKTYGGDKSETKGDALSELTVGVVDPRKEGFFFEFLFLFPGARHDGRAVFGGSEAAGEAEFLGSRWDV